MKNLFARKKEEVLTPIVEEEIVNEVEKTTVPTPTVKEVQAYLNKLGPSRPHFPAGISLQGGEYKKKSEETYTFDEVSLNHIHNEVKEYDTVIATLEKQLREARIRKEEGLAVAHNAHLVHSTITKEFTEKHGETTSELTFPEVGKVKFTFLENFDVVEWFTRWEGYTDFMEKQETEEVV